MPCSRRVNVCVHCRPSSQEWRACIPDRHPSVVRTRSAIAALEASLGMSVAESPEVMRDEVVRLIGERDALLQRYTPQHPEVARIDSQIESLEDRIATGTTRR